RACGGRSGGGAVGIRRKPSGRNSVHSSFGHVYLRRNALLPQPRMLIPRALLVVYIFAAALGAEDGAALYRKHCAGCHDSGAARVPSRAALQRLSPERILLTL